MKHDHKEPSRCFWCGTDPLYCTYHDTEWGVPVRNDLKMFELLLLETFQAGLSWITILRKRENFRKAFKDFNPETIARFTQKDTERLLTDAGIIRHRLKIEGAIKNAQQFLTIQDSTAGFADFIWQFTEGVTMRTPYDLTKEKLRATSPESDTMSKHLKKMGFAFVGSTVCYAHMQASGMVDDHIVGCFRYHAR